MATTTRRLTYDDLEAIPQERPGDRRARTRRGDSLAGNTPPRSGYHYVPLTTARPDTQFAFLDALDGYGIWKLTDALLACAFVGEWYEHAFGNTPEQRLMGAWSDGVPVHEPLVTDDPETA